MDNIENSVVQTGSGAPDASGQAAEQQAWIDRSLSVNSGSAIVVEALGIGQVKDLHTELLARLQQPEATDIDLSAVENVDAAGLQLMVAFQQEAIKRGQQVKIRGARESVVKSLSLLGLQLELAAA
ncbi:MAG: STAS domain-containing protein [Gammaproteobacteria bacterium]